MLPSRPYPRPFDDITFPKKASTFHPPFLIRTLPSSFSHVLAPFIFVSRASSFTGHSNTRCHPVSCTLHLSQLSSSSFPIRFFHFLISPLSVLMYVYHVAALLPHPGTFPRPHPFCCRSSLLFAETVCLTPPSVTCCRLCFFLRAALFAVSSAAGVMFYNYSIGMTSTCLLGKWPNGTYSRILSHYILLLHNLSGFHSYSATARRMRLTTITICISKLLHLQFQFPPIPTSEGT